VVFITTLICVSCHLLDASYLTSILAHMLALVSHSRELLLLPRFSSSSSLLHHLTCTIE